MSDVCCIIGCKPTKKKHVEYFEFPKTRNLNRRWVQSIEASCSMRSCSDNDSLICSRHFANDDYETVRGTTRLKSRSVPTVFEGCKKKKEIATPKKKQPKSSESLDTDNHVTTSRSKSKKQQKHSDSEPKTSPSCDKDNDNKTDDELSVNSKNEIVNGDKCSDEDSVSDKPSDIERIVSADKVDVNSTKEDKIVESVKPSNTQTTQLLITNNQVQVKEDNEEEDIENIITNYQILATKKLPEAVAEIVSNEVHKPRKRLKKNDHSSLEQSLDFGEILMQMSNKMVEQLEKTYPSVIPENGVPVDSSVEKSKDPVFIEVSVDKEDQGQQESDRDCLILLESVQCEVDPSALLMAPSDDEEGGGGDAGNESDVELIDKRPDPISLLTSSDDDEVIIEEPHIDTVDVSDETDEDDVPLSKMAPKPPAAKKPRKSEPETWPFDYYCIQCGYTSKTEKQFKEHVNSHALAVHVCDLCGYTTSSRVQYYRHRKKHKDDKKYKCDVCGFRAKHKMTIYYHRKIHRGVSADSEASDASNVRESYQCKECPFETDTKKKMMSHMPCKKYQCSKCEYKTRRSTDLARHMRRIHQMEVDDSDDNDWLDKMNCSD